MKFIWRYLFYMNKSHFCRNFFFKDWRHKRLKSTIDLLLFYGEHFYGFLEMKFSIKDLFSKCDQICRKVHIWSHLLKKSLMKNCIFCAVQKQLSTCVEKSWSENCFQYSQEIISLQLHQNITPVQVFSFKSEKLFRRFFLAAKYSGWLFLFKPTYHLNVFFPSLIFWSFIWTASAFLFRV